MSTVSTKPYLLRAIWEWCVDQGFTPYLATVVDARTRVPPGFARDGQIVLNLSPDATGQLQMGNELITFQARFGGVAHSLAVPVDNVLAIYARENGQGMAFGAEAEDAEEQGTDYFGDDSESGAVPAAGGSSAEGAPAEVPEKPKPPRGSHLKIVK